MNKVKHYFHLLAILISLGLVAAGCAIPTETIPTQVHSPTQPLPTVISTLPPQGTPTSVFPFHADLSCWQTKPLQAGNDIAGSLTLEYGSSSLYWDVSSFRAKSLSIVNNTPSRIPYYPPDGSYIPSYLSEDKKFNLVFPDKRSVALDLFPAGDYRFFPLLDGKIIITSWDDITTLPSENKSYKEGSGYTDTFYIYDSKTGSQLEKHSVLLPNASFFSEARLYVMDIVYSPNGYYVLYRSRLPDKNGKDGYSLLDLSTGQVKWTVSASKQIVGAVDEGPATPTWKPDGSGLTYIWTSDSEGKEQNFYNIALDGTISQMTKFEDVFQSGYILGYNPQWSPDGRYMAFKVRKAPYPSNDVETYIWDDVKKILLNPCIQAGIPAPLSWQDVGWSFDSQHLAASLPKPLTSDLTGSVHNWRNLILDVSDKVIYELPDDKTVRDYLKITDNTFSYSIGSWINWEIP